MEQQFSVGEYVERVIDGKVGRVKRAEPGVADAEGDFYFYVQFDERDKDDVWAGTTQAWRRHYRLHAHVSTNSRDCDGDYSGGHVDEMTTQERCDQFGDLHFKERVLGNVVSLHGEGTAEISPSGIHWREQTDEGYRAADVEWCEDECESERPWQRDHRAEAMGY
jgi:hypothetical protein